jgi:hypothetical protein
LNRRLPQSIEGEDRTMTIDDDLETHESPSTPLNHMLRCSPAIGKPVISCPVLG